MKENKGMQALSLLLVVALVGAMFVPVVSATEAQSSSTQSPVGAGKVINPPENYIPPEYFKDSKPAEPMQESEMINLIIPQKTIDSFNQDKNSGIISIPTSYLEIKTQYDKSKDYPNRYIAKEINSDEGVVLMRMPKDMLDRFLVTSKNNVVTLPFAYFFRNYDNLADLDSHVKLEGDVLTVNPNKNDVTLMEQISSVPSVIETPALENSTKTGTKSIMLTPQGIDTWHNERVFFERASTAKSYNYIIGQITPDTWYYTGNNDQYYAPQEREIYLNPYRQDAIEVVVNYDHHSNYPLGKVSLFPAIYDDYSDIIDLSDYEDSGAGIIELNPNSFPHSYGYHVEIYNGKYYIEFEDMDTLQWFDQYVYNDQDNPSTTFTEVCGSSEFFQHTSPITDTFYAHTVPIIDEWVRETSGTWRKPSQVWTLNEPAENENFVHINWYWGGSNSQELITESYAESGWA